MIKRIAVMLLACFFSGTALATASSGIYEIWYPENTTELPYIQGGQVMVQWGDLHAGPGIYDWSVLDEKLSDLSDPVTLQINGNDKPDYLFDFVPYTANWGETQVQDPQGILMYWHSDYIQAYSSFLVDLGEYIYNSPYRSNVLAIRQNFNAIGTEILNVPLAHRDASTWTVPPGANNGPDWTGARLYSYQKEILDVHLLALIENRVSPIELLIRNNLPPVVLSAQANGKPNGYTYSDYFQDGTLSWFHTSSEPEPRITAVANRYDIFHEYARTGVTRAYAESRTTAWGDHGMQTDATWAPPPQWNYWRLLSDLNMGVSYIAVYSHDMQVAFNGTYKGNAVGSDYKQQFDEAFQFAAQYAGYHDDPVNTPGAWIAFRDSTLDLEPSTYNERIKDYSMHMSLLNPDSTVAMDAREAGAEVPVVAYRTKEGQKSIGPYNQRYGAWARKIKKDETALFQLHEDFINEVNLSNNAKVKITYLDQYNASRYFKVSFGTQSTKVRLKNTGQWVTAEIPVNSDIIEAVDGSHLRIESKRESIVFHMVEIIK